uniref:DUF4042 domain-containing protein n=1 Tax=Mesocestoides corti TaxID=53468 RepID=A0A5K3G8E4_MESCO
KGKELVQEWLILALPSLLRREPQSRAFWASTICLLAASPPNVSASHRHQQKLLLAICLANPPSTRSDPEMVDYPRLLIASALVLFVTSTPSKGSSSSSSFRSRF